MNTLSKYIIISEEPIFFTNAGKFPFEYDLGLGGNIYDYNYMKVEEVIPKDDNTNVTISRYFFINSITLVNITAVIDYTEDVWTNYSKSMHLRKSLLTRSRATKYGSYTVPFYKLGMEYEGNNALSYTSLKTIYDNTDTNVGKCVLLAKIQLYQLCRNGAIGNTISRVVAIRYTRRTGSGTSTIAYNQVPINEDLFDLMIEIKKNQSLWHFTWDSTYKTTYGVKDDTTVQGNTDWYYELEDFILVPYKMGLDLTTSSVGFTMGQLPSLNTHFENVYVADVERSFYSGNQLSNGRPVLTTLASVTADFKNVGIGTYSNVYEVVENGTNYNISVLISCDDYNFDIFINVQNHLINITENYRVDVPISVQSADVTQQGKTARELERMTNELQIFKSFAGMVGNATELGTGIATAGLNGAKNSIIGSQMIAGSVGGFANNITGVAKGIKNLQILNTPLYRTAKGTFARSVGITNAYYGLFLFSVNPDNTTEVQANIDNAGYVVNEVVDDILQNMANDNNRPTYNVVSFDYVNNYGAFPENIRQQLVEILSNGTKIWYDTASFIAS